MERTIKTIVLGLDSIFHNLPKPVASPLSKNLIKLPPLIFCFLSGDLHLDQAAFAIGRVKRFCVDFSGFALALTAH